MSTIDREPEARAARFHVPTLQEIFWGPLARRMRAVAHWRRRGAPGISRPRMKFESLEPRVLLSADLAPQTADALGDGLGLLGTQVESFVSNDTAFDARVPLLLKLETDPVTGAAANEAPTVGDLLGVPVDANGDGNIATDFFGSDSDESVLQGLDQNDDGKVDAGEFLKGFFFDKVTQFLNSGAPSDTQDVADFLTDNLSPYNFFSPLDQTLDHLSGVYNVDFEVVDAHVADTTENPDAEATFSVGFKLTITHDAPIDLGLEADALKLLPFTGSTSDPKLVTVPVTSTLDFGFDFGVFTGGQTPAQINGFDFFVRKADPLLASVKAHDADLDFNLNVGFLGAKVVNGNFDLQADIATTLLDPNDPDALGFSDSQLGVEHTDSTVTSANAVPNADLPHSVGFFLRIGNVGITTPVSVADNGRSSFADLKTDIAAALATAQLGNLVSVDIDGGNRVKFSLVSTSDTPLGFANESYSQFGVIDATPDGDGANSFEYTSDQTFLLSVGGALPKLVRVHFPDASHTDIGFNNGQAAAATPLIAAAAPTKYDVTGDAGFTVTVRQSDGTEEAFSFTLTATETDGNANLTDLAQDIDDQMIGSSVYPLVQAVAGGDGKVHFNPLGSTSAIRVQASGTATSEIGFAADATSTLVLSAANAAASDLSQSARFKLALTRDTGSGTSTSTVLVAVPDNDRASLSDLASDINAAIDAALGANRIDVTVSGGRIVLKALSADVLAFSVKTINETIDDLVLDVNAALADAGLGGQVSASNVSGKLRLATAGGASIEISRTLTFDAGVTFAELFFAPDSQLFGAGVGAGSHATFELPVQVLPGLDDASTQAIDNWNPKDVSIVGNFSPLDTSPGATAEYDAQAKRFNLHFDLDPTMENQDTHVTPVPGSGSLNEEIRLVNMAELLNFNLVTAENMVGLLGGLGTALQQIADSALFAGYDIPFAAAALSGVLNFTDKKNGTGLIDKLIFDTGGDGIDGTKPDADRLLKKITYQGTKYLVPSFVTAQELGAKLHELLGAPLTGAGGINPTYDTVSNQLTYRVDLLADSDTTVTIDKAFQYDVSLSPFAKLSVVPATPPEGTDVTLTGRTGLGMTFGVDLSPPGAVIDEDTKLSDLNGGADSGLGAASTGVHIKTALAITGTKEIWTAPLPDVNSPPPSPDYQLSGDATFDLSINGGAVKHVTILKSVTYNKTMGDLVADVNNALVAAGVDLEVVKAASDGSHLVLTAVSSGTTFTITNPNAVTTDKIGFANGATANAVDFVITDRAGTAHAIVLDNLPSDPTVGDVIDAINAQAGGAVTAGFNATHTGLRLLDNTAGTGTFSVDSVNASPALLDLGLFLAGDANSNMQDRFDDGNPNLIEGGAISQVHLDRRFFVRDAAMRLDGLTLKAPDGGVPGEGLFGIVGVDTNFSGTMYAEVNAALQNPVSKAPGSQVTLAQLFDQTNAVGDPVVSKAHKLDYDNVITGTFKAGGVLVGSSGATAVIVAVEPGGTLILAHVNGNFADGDLISEKGVPVAAHANGTVTELENFGEFTLNVDVQDGFGELGFGPGFASLDGASYVVPVALTGFGKPGKPGIPGDPNANPPIPAIPAIAPVMPAASLDLSGIGDLAQFELLGYDDIAHALDGLEALLRDVDADFDLLNTKLPAINRSVSDLLSLVSGFAHSVDNADAALGAAQAALDQALDMPAPRLQDIPRLLRGAFGLPNGVDPDASGAVNWVRLDFDPTNHMLDAELSLEQTLSTKLGLDIEVGSGLPNLTSGGVLEVAGVLDVNLHFGIDLQAPSDAYIYDDSTISASLDVVGEGQEYSGGEDGLGLVFYSSIGPLAVFIQDGDANIHVAFDLPMKEIAGTHRKLLDDASFDDFDAPNVSQDTVDIALPMFYGGEGPNDLLGEFKATGSLGGGLTITTPSFQSLADDIGDGTIPFDPIDNIQLAVDTVNVYLENLSDDISARVLSTKLPFAGNQLADVLFIEEFRTTLVRALKEGIAGAVNPNPDSFIQDLLNGVFGPGGALNGYLQGGVQYDANLVGPVDTRYRQWNVTLHHVDAVTLSDFDLGIPGLTFDLDTPVTVNFDWTMELGFGVDFGRGAYIDVSDASEVDLKLDITLPGPHQGQLGFLRIDETDPGNDTGAHVEFTVDVQNGNDSGAAKLAFAELGAVDAIASVQGGALDGESDAVTLHLVTQTTFGLPTLSADLLINWTLDSTPLDVLVGADAVTPGIQLIALNDIVLDAGSVAEQLLGPLFDDVKQFIDPFMPVVDTLTAPIPILSDLAGEPFTLIDLAGIFGNVDPAFLNTVADILDVIAAINDFINAPELPLGDLILYDVSGGINNFDPNDPSAVLADVGQLLTSQGLSTPGLTHDTSNDPGSYNDLIQNNFFLRNIRDETLADGLTMPILVDPLQGMKLLLGDPTATLVEYELKPLTVGFDYTQVFPVWGPLAVSIEIGFDFNLNLHSVGFDTYGYKRYADGGFRNPAVIFDGFFLNDRDENNVDAPEVTMSFGLVGAAELNLGVASAGVAGGIDATITFDWHDSIPDGHVHLSEIIGNVVANDGNPLAAFDVGGELSFQLFAFLKILSFEKDFPITPETTLYSYEDTSSRDPILATDLKDGTLQLNMGPNAKDRLNGDVSDGNEDFHVKLEGGHVKVWSPKLGIDESEAQDYGSGFTRIVGLGGLGDDVIELSGFDGSNIQGDFDGGVGDDRIEYIGSTASNSGPGARIVGGLGNDTLTGGALNDVIIGGQGSDTIKGGGGHDILFGDNGTVTDTSIASRIGTDDGADTVEGGEGDDVLIGAGGDDTLKGDGGADVIIGDGGRFDYAKTDGHVDVAALRPAPYVPTPISSYKDPAQISAEIDALYDVMAGEFFATDLGFGGNDGIEGGGGGDLILAGSGDDTVHGDGGDDVILGGKGFDDLHGGGEKDSIFGGDQADTISGDGGDDVISGGSGGDFIHGNDGDDVMKGDTGADVMFGDADDDQVFGLTEPDVLFGGIGNDLVVGGTSNDVMFGDDGIVAKLNPADGSGYRVIGIGNPALITSAFYDGDKRTVDLIVTDVVAGDGNDVMSGDAGDDLMLGGGGNDLMGGDVDPRLPSAGSDTPVNEDVLIGDGGKITFDQRYFRSIETVPGPDTTGTPFDDVIYGDNGNDYIFGGRGSDLLFGGHGSVVTDVTAQTLGTFRGATDEGAADNDIIVGDNGRMDFADDTVPANFGVLTRVRTTDTSDDTGGHEYAEGELGDDVIFGGTNASVDVLYGNAGNDVVLGDNGELDWDLDGLHDLSTLDLIRSYRDGVGGEDHISGNAGDDVLIGGTGGDLMYGDDQSASAGAADGEDIMLGDNADIFLVGNVGRLKVRVADMAQATAVDLITTTDTSDTYGGADTMSGNAKADVMLGGVNHGGEDHLYGDRESPTSATIANDSDDILLGDNGELDFTFESDTDRNTVDLIRSYEDGWGGTDRISGDKGLDVAIGGTGDDFIYGDDLAASAAGDDLGDLLLGDNADVFLVAPLSLGTGNDLKLVLSAAVKTIRTTDEEHPEYGGADTISGNAGGDIIAGGVAGDTLYGDALSVVPALDGDDIILGDNGAFEWLSTGRLSEITGIDIGANNSELWAKYGTNTADGDLTTLDLVTTEQPTSGGRDTIYGDEGSDLVFGGTDLDWIHGDDGNEVAEVQGSPNRDVLFGDHGRIYPQFSALENFNSRNFFAIDIGDNKGGEGDIMYGEEGDDVMLGQQGDDRMWGGSEDDDMIGGHNVSGGIDELTLPAVQATLNPPMNDLMDGGSGDDAMSGDNAIVWRRGGDVSPRFRTLTQAAIYTTGPDGVDTITTNVGTLSQSDPADAVGRDIELLDHADTTSAGLYGADVMAGGADSDVMFGQLGDDLMQGDGNIGADDMDPDFVTRHVGVTDSGMPDTSEDLYFNVPELGGDADDYMEGNGGGDLMYGGLGQDDMIGGSSALFGLDTEAERPDGADVIFGGAGAPARLARNDFVGASDSDTGTADGVGGVPTADDPSIALANRHARDADFIMGDNANVFRLVGAGDAFLQFNYDQTTSFENRGTERIVVRAMQQLDYTLGGSDYAGGAYVNGAAQPVGQPADNGAADLIHGESGDDVVFGMTGSDVIFGESDDDDLVGGYGNDWISGGTGQDGVIGDDGLVYTSRNSTLGEPLYGVAGLLASDANTKYNNGDALNEIISTPGDIQYAVINVEGQLKKTADLVPFSFDKGWIANDDEFPDDASNTPFADDIIFGGLGSDFLHGGSGDDAISGAEALEHAYVPTFDGNGNANGVRDLGYNAFDLPDPVNPGYSEASPNPGNVLAFNPVDLDGQHLNNRFRAGEFYLYDEYDPLRRIQLNGSGELWKPGDAGTPYEFLLNFDQSEGVFRASGTVPKATGQQTDSYPAVNDDGKDSIFGDLANDWLVGGTGRDNLYGGWGNDLLNADDDLRTDGDANDQPDTHPTYEDRAYGGAGRDVLIGNTGGDRLIDWVGEYNSFLVPYAPFGQASVSRTLMPHLHEFLYALSAGDGADFTRYADAIGGTPPAPTNNDPIPSRNGEPFGELGLVLQKDFAWGDQTGAPADPQAGNIPGGKRDVLRTAGFNDGTASGFAVDSGSFTVQSGKLSVAAASLGLDATAVLPMDDQLPGYYEVLATVTVEKPTAGWKANSYIVFDYFDDHDFKFAGINISTNKVEVGYRDASGWHVVKDTPNMMKAGTSYNLMVAVNGTNVTVVLDNATMLSYTFAPRIVYGEPNGLNMGMVGLGSDNSRGTFDNFTVQRVPPAWTLQQTEDFASGTGTLFDGAQTGTWQLANGRYAGNAPATSLVDLGIGRGLETDAVLELSAVLRTDGAGGFMFDRYADNDYKFVTIDAAADKVIIGHVSPKGGVVVDASFVRTIDAGKDYTLTLRLKGTSVSVNLGGQAVGGFVFNAVTVDGDFGLLAARGTTSFDSATVRTSDSAFYVPASSLLAATPAATASGATLTQSELDGITTVAISQWTEALGAGDARLAALADVRFEVAQLTGAALGLTEGDTILVDVDAAGWGWFVDTSPASSSEFRVRLDSSILAATPESAAFGKMDLLTTVEHELGHLLGFDHGDAGTIAVMNEELDAGVRYVFDTVATTSVPQAGDAARNASVPGFDTYAGDGGLGAAPKIDWQSGTTDGWSVTLSPYDTGKPAQNGSNIAPFDLSLLAKQGQDRRGADFDGLGKSLLGKDRKPQG